MQPEQFGRHIGMSVRHQPVGLVEQAGMDVDLAFQPLVLVGHRRAALRAEGAGDVLRRAAALRRAFDGDLVGAEAGPDYRRRAALAAAIAAMAPRDLERLARRGEPDRAAEAAAV